MAIYTKIIIANMPTLTSRLLPHAWYGLWIIPCIQNVYIFFLLQNETECCFHRCGRAQLTSPFFSFHFFWGNKFDKWIWHYTALVAPCRIWPRRCCLLASSSSVTWHVASGQPENIANILASERRLYFWQENGKTRRGKKHFCTQFPDML